VVASESMQVVGRHSAAGRMLLRAALCCALVCGMVAAAVVIGVATVVSGVGQCSGARWSVVMWLVACRVVSSSLAEPFKPCRGRLRALAPLT
jgi:hypothetical protein